MKTIDEAITAANIATRAKRLFEDGYRIERTAALVETYLVTSAEGKEYVVAPTLGTCNCPYFTHNNTDPFVTAKPCKHLLGWELLLQEQTDLEKFALYIAEINNAEGPNGVDYLF